MAAIAADAAPTVPGVVPKTHLLELTSTRFFAAMAVLLGHFNDFIGMPEWLARWISGGFGVSFFFVLSGFILCYVYWEHFESGPAREPYRRYLIARFARIYPSYAAALVLITAFYLLENAIRPGTFQPPANALTSWLANLFALQTFAPSIATQQAWNAPSWSISTEFGFYLVCPLILAALAAYCRGTRRLLALLVATWVYAIAMQAAIVVLVFRYGWDQQFWADIVASRNIFWRIHEFLTGVIAARLLYGGHVAWLARSALFRNLLLLASLALVTVLNLAPWPADPASIVVMRQFRLDVAYTIPFAGIVLALAAGPTFASPLLSRPSWVFLGDISYGIYIYHWIPWTILAHAQAFGLKLPLFLVTGVVLGTIMFSAASYLWYERPARLFLRRKFGH
jgi:peptidoglycan/LPS O-acetylase OafA/YrhL